MSKDPAFLFYSQDFYAGTRDMLPEERACYIDLLIYQHQRGIIPKDTKRVLMFCSGVSEATLVATLQAKFSETDKGWLNERLQREVEKRVDFKQNASERGKLGALFKLAKQSLNKDKMRELKDVVYNKVGVDDVIKTLCSAEATLEATLKGLVKHLENENENENENRSLVEREENFKKSVFAFRGKYSESMLEQFYLHYSQVSEGGRKMHFEKQPTWDLAKRLVTWAKKNQEWGRDTQPDNQKVDKINIFDPDVIKNVPKEFIRRFVEKYGWTEKECVDTWRDSEKGPTYRHIHYFPDPNLDIK